MNYLWPAIAGVIFLWLTAAAVFYFLNRDRGKSYVAVSVTSTIGAIWASYASLLGVNWPNVVVAVLLRSDPDKVAKAAEPNLLTIGGALPAALVLSWFIFRLGQSQIRSGQYPQNASAREIEEPGRAVSLLELATAHGRYVASGKPDRPLHAPGDDPYSLPTLSYSIEWPALSADLLCQLEPNLLRESFRYLHEKKFYRLSGADPFDESRSRQWIVLPLTAPARNKDIVAHFESLPPASSPTGEIVEYVCCIRSDTHRSDKIQLANGVVVRVLTEAALIQGALDFSQYAASLVRRFEHRLVPGTSYTLKQCFVAPKAKKISPSSNFLGLKNSDDIEIEIDLMSILRDWAEGPDTDHLSIIGEFGQGKSTALLAYCCDWAHEWAAGRRSGRIPLLIELRGKSPRRQPQDRFLAEWGDRYGLRGEALLSLVQAGRAILIFEGFDEVQDAGLRFDRFEQFRSLWSFSYPGAKIVFTGRPNFFLDTDERERLLRSSQSAIDAGLSNTTMLSLCFLDHDSIEAALNRYPAQTTKEIIDQCRIDPAFFDIAKRPSMLPVIGNQWARIRSDLDTLEGTTSASIISYFIEFLYSRKEADQDRLGDYQLLSRILRHYFTQRIAWSMVRSRLHNTVDQDTFVSAIEEGLRDIDVEFRGRATADPAVATAVSALKERFKDRPQADMVAAVATDVRTNGIFAPDPAGGRDNLYFPHKQYFEFIVGQIAAAALPAQVPESWVGKLSKQELLAALRREPVSLFFTSGLLDLQQLLHPPRPTVADTVRRVSGAWVATLSLAINALFRRWGGNGPSSTDLLRNIPIGLRYLFLSAPEEYGPAGRLRYLSASTAAAVAAGTAATTTLTFVLDSTSTVGLFGGLEGIVILLMGTATLAAATLVAGRMGPVPSDVGAAYLIMDVYRTGRPRRVEQMGSRAAAAVICVLAERLPRGAVDFHGAVLERAFAELGYRPAMRRRGDPDPHGADFES